MAKRTNEPTSGSAKAKVRVFFAELEGNNESVQEALKTMVAAMSRPVRIVGEPRSSNTNALLDIPHDDTETPEIESEPETEEDEELQQSPRRPRGTGKKTDRNSGLGLVPDLNFRPAGKATLKDFITEKSPKNDLEATVAVVHYMQHSMQLPKIGPSHILTALKEVNKAIPVDLRQTIRNTKRTKMWLNFTDLDDLHMTTQGDNFVEHELGKAGD